MEVLVQNLSFVGSTANGFRFREGFRTTFPKVAWRSWLSHQSHTLVVPGLSPGEIIYFLLIIISPIVTFLTTSFIHFSLTRLLNLLRNSSLELGLE